MIPKILLKIHLFFTLRLENTDGFSVNIFRGLGFSAFAFFLSRKRNKGL
jgi:hypothetical protein